MRSKSVRHIVAIAGAIAMVVVMRVYFARRGSLTDTVLTAAGFPGQRYFSDLYPRWLGSRELLLHHQDPYTPQVTRNIQRGYYGRPIDPQRATDPVDEQRFAYPLYVVFFFAPTILFSFPAARLIWDPLLVLFAGGSVLLWLRAVGVKSFPTQQIVCILLALSTLPFMQALQLEQLSLLVGFLAAWCIAALVRGRLDLAGVLLALATVKPQLVALLALFLFVWTLGSWRQRRRLLLAFAITMVMLIAAASIFLPSWPIEFVHGLKSYVAYTNASSILQAFFGKHWGTAISVVAAASVLVLSWKFRRMAPDSLPFRLLLALAVSCTCLTIPSMAPHNQVLLVPAYLLLLSERRQIWNIGRVSRALYLAAWGLLIWSWATGIISVLAINEHRHYEVFNLPFATNPVVPSVCFVLFLILTTRTDVPHVEAIEPRAHSHAQ
ncbi:MAG TPA: glycosyltransferase family 87 protein [Terriglobales bacterium]|nr:glycosyltransferase family 87 protein [Terriglobales bacterium]